MRFQIGRDFFGTLVRPIRGLTVSRFVFGSLKLVFSRFAPGIDLFWVNLVQRLGILEGFKSLVLVDKPWIE